MCTDEKKEAIVFKDLESSVDLQELNHIRTAITIASQSYMSVKDRQDSMSLFRFSNPSCEDMLKLQNISMDFVCDADHGEIISKRSGLHATITINGNDVFLAFSGLNGNGSNIREKTLSFFKQLGCLMNHAVGIESRNIAEAQSLAIGVKNILKPGQNLTITGHSKGGQEAQAGALYIQSTKVTKDDSDDSVNNVKCIVIAPLGLTVETQRKLGIETVNIDLRSKNKEIQQQAHDKIKHMKVFTVENDVITPPAKNTFGYRYHVQDTNISKRLAHLYALPIVKNYIDSVEQKKYRTHVENETSRCRRSTTEIAY